jgi:nitrite reductase (NADH) small subunit
MLVVRFQASGVRNCAEVAGAAYVYARTAQGGFVLSARCPHRGGPLNLAEPTPGGDRLVCPWHSGKSSLARLRRQVPAVRTGNAVTAVLPAPPGAEAELSHRPMSAALAADTAGPAG